MLNEATRCDENKFTTILFLSLEGGFEAGGC